MRKMLLLLLCLTLFGCEDTETQQVTKAETQQVESTLDTKATVITLTNISLNVEDV